MHLAQLPMLIAQAAGDADVTGVGILMIVVALLGLVGTVVWLWAIVDAIRNPVLSGTARAVWVFGIVITGLIGVILYVLIGRQPNKSVGS